MTANGCKKNQIYYHWSSLNIIKYGPCGGMFARLCGAVVFQVHHGDVMLDGCRGDTAAVFLSHSTTSIQSLAVRPY